MEGRLVCRMLIFFLFSYINHLRNPQSDPAFPWRALNLCVGTEGQKQTKRWWFSASILLRGALAFKSFKKKKVSKKSLSAPKLPRPSAALSGRFFLKTMTFSAWMHHLWYTWEEENSIFRPLSDWFYRMLADVNPHHQMNPPGLKTLRSEPKFSLTTCVNDLRASSGKTDTHDQAQEGREEDLGLPEEAPSHAGGARTCEITCSPDPRTKTS